jgi:hypothetical protein
MLTLEPGLFFRVQELTDGPKPLPLKSGFSLDKGYRALGLFNPSETSDAYFIFANDREEIWFICNRHLRAVGLVTTSTALSLTLHEAMQLSGRTTARPAHESKGEVLHAAH